MVKLERAFLCAAMLFVVEALYGQAGQKSSDAAPIPPAVAAAKKVFISNAGADNSSSILSGGADRCYNEFYHGIEALHRYEIVSSPADADIVLEIRLSNSVLRDEAANKYGNVLLRLRILDPKTHIVLWAFFERPQRANFQHTWDKHLDQAIERIVTDMKSVAGAPNSPNP